MSQLKSLRAQVITLISLCGAHQQCMLFQTPVSHPASWWQKSKIVYILDQQYSISGNGAKALEGSDP
jgi:hypothetical protein